MKTNREKTYLVNITTEHEQFVVSKKIYQVFIFGRFILHLVIGTLLAILLYNECLHCKDCNMVVIIFLSIISLGCFINIGLPIDKLSNLKIS